MSGVRVWTVRRVRMRTTLLAAVACAVLLGLGGPRATADTVTDPAPAGANDFSCRPSAAHPRPVVLVHGLTVGMSPAMWATMSPELRARGWCVYALNYGLDPRLPGVGGVQRIEDSAPELDAFVARVLAASGTTQVDLVGGSLGTFMPQYWLKRLGGAPKVHRYVAIGSLYAGTTFALFRAFGPACGACAQIGRGSATVRLLREGGIAAPGVQYTSITSRYDEIVTPATSGRIDEPGQEDIVLQDVCPLNVSEHFLLTTDPDVLRLTLNALDPEHRGPLTCPGARQPPAPARLPAPVGAPDADVPPDSGATVATLRTTRSISRRGLLARGLRVVYRAAAPGRVRITVAVGRRTIASGSRTVAAGRTVAVRLRPARRVALRRGASPRLRITAAGPSASTIVRHVRVRG